MIHAHQPGGSNEPGGAHNPLLIQSRMCGGPVSWMDFLNFIEKSELSGHEVNTPGAYIRLVCGDPTILALHVECEFYHGVIRGLLMAVDVGLISHSGGNGLRILE